jgi:hypothetical protein
MSPPKSQAIGVESQSGVGQAGRMGLSRQNMLAGCGRATRLQGVGRLAVLRGQQSG